MNEYSLTCTFRCMMLSFLFEQMLFKNFKFFPKTTFFCLVRRQQEVVLNENKTFGVASVCCCYPVALPSLGPTQVLDHFTLPWVHLQQFFLLLLLLLLVVVVVVMLMLMLLLLLKSIVVCKLHSPIWLLHVQNSHRSRANHGENSAARQRGQIQTLRSTHAPTLTHIATFFSPSPTSTSCLEQKLTSAVRTSAQRPHFRSALQCCFKKGIRKKKVLSLSLSHLHASKHLTFNCDKIKSYFFSFPKKRANLSRP